MAAAPAALPPVVEVLNEEGRSPFVLVCEHASRFMPERFASLGLPESELVRHIAWDIGAKTAAFELSRLLDAPLVHANYSRLIVDLNRPHDSASLIPEVSERTVIPGNRGLTPEQRRQRIEEFHTPFHTSAAALLDRRVAAGKATHLVAIHSFTPVFKGEVRGMEAGILFRRSEHFGRALVEALGGDTAKIAANAPYRIEDGSDYTVPVHGEARGLEAVLVELRQDLIAEEAGAKLWARRLALALEAVRPLLA